MLPRLVLPNFDVTDANEPVILCEINYFFLSLFELFRLLAIEVLPLLILLFETLAIEAFNLFTLCKVTVPPSSRLGLVTCTNTPIDSFSM